MKPLPEKMPAVGRPASPSNRTRGLLAANGFPAMLLCMSACAGLVWLRMLRSGSASFSFLPWNLALAFVPYAASLFAAARDGRGRLGGSAIALGLVTLLFLPNSFYVVTDILHFRARPPIPAWFDAGMLALAAGTGWFLGLLSLRIWKDLLSRRLGNAAAWGLMVLASVACGYGIYLGRFLRWNSWDVVRTPRPLFAEILAHLTPPWDPDVVAVTLFFGGLVLITFLAVEMPRRAHAE